ncbi:MAG: hemolysin family protein [Oscillospiraceae bacterium]|nr:hemolysin family protein [Oscillospiraceae bacterium]
MESDEHNRSLIEPSHSKGNLLLASMQGLNKLTSRFLRKTGKDGYTEMTEEILSRIDESNESGLFEESSVEMISNVFEFNALEARDVMTHRVDIVALKANSKIEDVIYLALDEGFSRIPIYKKTIDDIDGIIIAKDLLSLIGKPDYNSYELKSFVREVPFIPESCSCNFALKKLIGTNSGMAVLVDEYGGTAGIVTLEDLIEAIVGNISDEHDNDSAQIKKIGKNTYEIDGNADPDDVLELFGHSLPDDHEYDTMTGLITDLTGCVPELSEIGLRVNYEDICFIIKEVKKNRIGKIVATLAR